MTVVYVLEKIQNINIIDAGADREKAALLSWCQSSPMYVQCRLGQTVVGSYR